MLLLLVVAAPTSEPRKRSTGYPLITRKRHSGVALPALRVRSSARASRTREAVRNLSRRVREEEGPRRSDDSSPISSLPPSSIQTARQSSRNSRSASSTGEGGGEHQYSLRDAAVLLALARHRHQSTVHSSNDINTTSYRQTTSTSIRMPALTVYYDPSLLDPPSLASSTSLMYLVSTHSNSCHITLPVYLFRTSSAIVTTMTATLMTMTLILARTTHCGSQPIYTRHCPREEKRDERESTGGTDSSTRIFSLRRV